jgi:hypothetical protein
VLENETLRHAQILVGPASQIIVVESDELPPADFDVSEVRNELSARLERLTSPRPVPYDDGEGAAERLPEEY